MATFAKLGLCRATLGEGERNVRVKRRAVLGAVLLRPFAAQAAARSSMEAVLDDPKWPEDFPFRPEDFRRYDETPDSEFYAAPRFVTHIDDPAIAALRQFSSLTVCHIAVGCRYYGKIFPAGEEVCYLDLCSSWISHYPRDVKAQRISGLGMNEAELARNAALTDYAVHDLNHDPILPYEDCTFDVITNAVSVDYLARPLEVFREMHRVLKPEGLALMSFSNRCFPTKAIQIWTGTGDADHIFLVGSYFHYAVKGFFGGGDPMYVVSAQKI